MVVYENVIITFCFTYIGIVLNKGHKSWACFVGFQKSHGRDHLQELSLVLDSMIRSSTAAQQPTGRLRPSRAPIPLLLHTHRIITRIIQHDLNHVASSLRKISWIILTGLKIHVSLRPCSTWQLSWEVFTGRQALGPAGFWRPMGP